MESDAEADAELARHDLQYTARISDPERQLYAFFELETERKGLLRRAIRQLPGTFLLSKGEIVKSHRTATPPRLPFICSTSPSARVSPDQLVGYVRRLRHWCRTRRKSASVAGVSRGGCARA